MCINEDSTVYLTFIYSHHKVFISNIANTEDAINKLSALRKELFLLRNLDLSVTSITHSLQSLDSLQSRDPPQKATRAFLMGSQDVHAREF